MILSSLLLYALSSMSLGASPLEIDSTPKYTYVNMNGGPGIGFFDGYPKVQIGDEIVEIVDCSTATLLCGEAEGVYVAIPIGNLGYAADGKKIVVSKQTDVNFFGLHARARIIDATRGSAKYRYWYSDELGLLAFTITEKDASVTYLLEQSIGLKARKRPVPPKAKP